MRQRQEDERPRFGTIQYHVLYELNVTISEHVLLDMVYHLSGKHGHCYKSTSSIARDMRLTFNGVKKMVERLVARELLVCSSKGLRCAAAYTNTAYVMSENIAQSAILPRSVGVKKVQSKPKIALSSQRLHSVHKSELSSDKNTIRIQKNNKGTDPLADEIAEFVKMPVVMVTTLSVDKLPTVKQRSEPVYKTVGNQLPAQIRLDNNVELQKVFDTYISAFNKSPNRYKLTDPRKGAIKRRIADAGIEMVLEAITNASNDAFFNGSKGWYGDLDYLLRSYANIEKYANLSDNAQSRNPALEALRKYHGQTVN